MADHPKASHDTDIEVHGRQNVTITGDVGGNITVTIGGRDVRAEELAYLDGLIEKYRYWAEKYTPLAGIAEVRAAVAEGPRLDLPMLFMPTGFEKLEEHGFGEQRETERVPVDDLRDAVTRYKRLVVLGEPGSGKTTTLWRLAYDLAVTAKEDPRAPLPVFVPLGGYTGPENAQAYVQGFFEEHAPYLSTYLRGKRVILLLDALNEMPQTGYKERVGRIHALLDQYPDLSMVVTCRALDYVETLNLEKLEVRPLEPEQQREYLYRYLGAEEGEKLFWQMAGSPAVADIWRAWQQAGGTWEKFWITKDVSEDIPDEFLGVISSKLGDLWYTVRKYGLPPLLELGRNPYFLVLTAQVYAACGVLPENRSQLFAAFVDTLLGREEKRCHPASWPGANVLRNALTRLAYAMQNAGERGTETQVAWAIQQIGEPGLDAKQIIRLGVNATLLEINGKKVRFTHQLLQEYFAALALAELLKEDHNWRGYWGNDWAQPAGWEETFILAAGIVPDVTPLVDILLATNPVLAARCIVESGIEASYEKSTHGVRMSLVGVVESLRSPVTQRNAAGDALNYLGDPRTGVRVENGIPNITWCEVPEGEFIIGNTRMNDEMAYYNEAPQHKVQLETYAISKYCITNAQFEAFVHDGGYEEEWGHCWTPSGLRWKDNKRRSRDIGGQLGMQNHPAVEVTWYEAVAFCNWLSEKLGRRVSLPTEEQWEKAARGTDGRRYPWGDMISTEKANYTETGIKTTSAVGIFPKGESPYGALDMSGNVWEWCLNEWREDYDTPADGSTNRIVVRGGSYNLIDKYVRCAARYWFSRSERYSDLGFRIVAIC